MSFLRGKTTGYTRYIANIPNARTAVDAILGEQIFRPIIPDNNLHESVGTCSWRSLLDGPVDRGYLDGHPDIYACGIRRDTRKAPPALVQAETARAVSDYMQTCGGMPNKDHIKTLKDDIRDDLNKQAQPKPTHSTFLMNHANGMVLMDGSNNTHSPFIGKLLLAPFYSDGAIEGLLDWLLWAGAEGSIYGNLWPEQEATWKDADGDGAILSGAFDIFSEMRERKLLQQSVHSAKFSLVAGDLTTTLTLNRKGLKVSGLTFPDDILNATGDLEARMLVRAGYLFDVEAALGSLVADYLTRMRDNNWPEDFKAGVLDAA